jgi:hypothetical protein
VSGYVSASLVYARDSGRTYSATSQPNDAQVDGFIIQTAAEIDAILAGRGFLTPVASAATSVMAFLEHGNALGAQGLIEHSAPNGQGKVDMAVKLWESFKKTLETGAFDLPSVPASTSRRVRASTAATALFIRDE